MVFGGHMSWRELFDEGAIQPTAVLFFIQVVLRNRNQVVLLVNVESEFMSDGLEQLPPIDRAGTDGKSRAGEDGNVLFFQLFYESFNEVFGALVHAFSFHPGTA